MRKHTTNPDSERLVEANRLTETNRGQLPNPQLGEHNQEPRPHMGQRHTVKEAAEVLRTTVDAVRGRIRRGTLDSLKVDRQVYVLLDATNREQHSDKSASDSGDGRGLPDVQSELVAELRSQNEWLRREVERKACILMEMAQRIPDLEAPSESPEGPQTALEDLTKGDRRTHGPGARTAPLVAAQVLLRAVGCGEATKPYLSGLLSWCWRLHTCKSTRCRCPVAERWATLSASPAWSAGIG